MQYISQIQHPLNFPISTIYRAFKRFIRDYGTHYVSSAYLGSKVAVKVFYDNYERLKFGRQRLFNW